MTALSIRHLQELVFAAVSASEENQIEPLGELDSSAEKPLQIIRPVAGNDKPLKRELRICLHNTAFNPDRRL
jgi:hypothetical protein